MSPDELRATCRAYARLVSAVYPALDPAIATKARRIDIATSEQLITFLDEAIARADATGSLRIAWKLGPDLVYRGASALVVADAGLSSAVELLGKTDFHPSIGWARQSSKYRRDDLDVLNKGEDKFDILERLDSPEGTVWLRTHKALVRVEESSVGVLLAYETLSAEEARVLMRTR